MLFLLGPIIFVYGIMPVKHKCYKDMDYNWQKIGMALTYSELGVEY